MSGSAGGRWELGVDIHSVDYYYYYYYYYYFIAGDEAGARHKKRGCTHEGNTAAGGGTLGAWGRHAMESERQWHRFQPMRALRVQAHFKHVTPQSLKRSARLHVPLPQSSGRVVVQ